MVIYEAALVVEEHLHALRAVALQKTEVTTTTKAPLVPLFETAVRRTHRGGVCRSWDPIKTGCRSLAGHSSVTQDP